MSAQYTIRLNTPKQFRCPGCKKISIITEVIITDEGEPPDQDGNIRAITSFNCMHCNKRIDGTGTFKKITPPRLMN